MNTANLQMEGLLLALAALLDAMKRNGLLSREEVQAALDQAEKAGSADGQRPDELSHAQVEAILFPIRFLKQVNAYEAGEAAPYEETAREVGRNKPERPE